LKFAAPEAFWGKLRRWQHVRWWQSEAEPQRNQRTCEM